MPRDSRWIWLVLGAALLPFTAFQTVVPLAAWLAPAFLLRFVRTSTKEHWYFPIIVLCHIAAYMISFRNGFVPMGILVMLIGTLFYGLIHSIPYWVDRVYRTRKGESAGFSGLVGSLIFPLTVTTIDWLMSLVNPFATYGSPAYSQAGNLALTQMVSVTGLWGLTFLISWCAPVVNSVWEEGFDSPNARRSVKAFASVLAVVILLGSARLTFLPPNSPTVRVAALTPERALWEKAATSVAWDKIGSAPESQRDVFRQRFAPFLDELFARTLSQAQAGAKIIVWSEGAAFILKEDESAVIDRAKEIARREAIYLEMGLGIFLRTNNPPFIENRAVLIDPLGNVVWEYDKAKPVPGESPMITAGPGIIPSVETPYGRLGTAICYDMDYPLFLRQAGKLGIDILLVPSNDFEAHKFTHSQMASFRAVENGFSLVRPASLGISVATDYQGRVLASADYFASDASVMVANVPIKGAATLYARLGDPFAYVSCIGLVFMAIQMVFTRKR